MSHHITSPHIISFNAMSYHIAPHHTARDPLASRHITGPAQGGAPQENERTHGHEEHLIRATLSESPYPSHLVRVTLSESPYPSRIIRVIISESPYPSHLLRVALSESHYPSRLIRVALSAYTRAKVMFTGRRRPRPPKAGRRGSFRPPLHRRAPARVCTRVCARVRRSLKGARAHAHTQARMCKSDNSALGRARAYTAITANLAGGG